MSPPVPHTHQHTRPHVRQFISGRTCGISLSRYLLTYASAGCEKLDFRKKTFQTQTCKEVIHKVMGEEELDRSGVTNNIIT